MGETDLISRQDAIDVVRNYYDPEDHSTESIEDRIKRLPSAQRWIPCERELPEVGRSVLISVGGMYTAEGCLREDGDWVQFRWNGIQRKDMVGAWQPLPEPYKGDQDG